MTQALTKPITVQQFLAAIPENSSKHYELHNGTIVEMAQPPGEYEDIVGFLVEKIAVEYVRLALPYSMTLNKRLSLFTN